MSSSTCNSHQKKTLAGTFIIVSAAFLSIFLIRENFCFDQESRRTAFSAFSFTYLVIGRILQSQLWLLLLSYPHAYSIRHCRTHSHSPAHSCQNLGGDDIASSMHIYGNLSYPRIATVWWHTEVTVKHTPTTMKLKLSASSISQTPKDACSPPFPGNTRKSLSEKWQES